MSTTSNTQQESGWLSRLSLAILRLDLFPKNPRARQPNVGLPVPHEVENGTAHSIVGSDGSKSFCWPRGPKTSHKPETPSHMFDFTKPILRKLRIYKPPRRSSDVRKHGESDSVRPSSSTGLLQRSASSASISESYFHKQANASELQILQDRAIRAEQDAALELALKRDQERLAAALEANKCQNELNEQARKRIECERIARELAETEKQNQIAWRRWARRALIPKASQNQGVKIAVRMPNGKRCTGYLPLNASLEILHTLVETFFIPEECSVDSDPAEAPESYIHDTEFRLVVVRPRIVLENDEKVTLGSCELLQKGVLLIVEQRPDESATECMAYESDDDDDEGL